MPGVFAVGPAAVAMVRFEPRADAWQMAAVLCGGDGSALSHASAAARLGAWKRWDGRITVTSPRRVRVDDQAAMRFVHAPVPPAVIVFGVPVTCPARTIADLGTELTAYQVCHVVHEAVFLGLVDLVLIEDELVLRGGARGVATVRKAIRLYRAGSAGTRSATEDRMLDAILRSSLPVPLVNNRNAADVQGIEPDLAWPRAKLIVEIDGSRGHDHPGKREHDRRRDEALEAQGWTIIRFDAGRVWHDLPGVVREIEELHRSCLRRAARSAR